MYSASCLCGGIQFRIHADLAAIELCHCQQCRKAQGGPFASNIPLARSSLEWLAGEELLTSFESSPGKLRCFCKTCGSPVFSTRSATPETVRIRAGIINEAIPVRPVSHAYVAAQCNWWHIEDDLPQFPAARL